MNTHEWLDPSIARQQRDLVDAQIDRKPEDWPAHFQAIANAIRETQCPGSILEIGCGVGHGREILDRAGVDYRSYTGADISEEAIAIARQRYPESDWVVLDRTAWFDGPRDIVIDGSCMLHIEDWREHVAKLCKFSRRWVVLHRVPIVDGDTHRNTTTGYGHVFDAWMFSGQDVIDEMAKHGFGWVGDLPADGHARTLTFAKPRHFATYADRHYLPQLAALHRSMQRHCGPFQLHVLAWDTATRDWAERRPGIDVTECESWLPEALQRDALPGPTRSKAEHMWTVGPAFIAYVMGTTQQAVTYVDADLMFFSSPEPVFAEIGRAPTAVVPHAFARYADRLPGPTVESHSEAFGLYNNGFTYFADSEMVEWWAEECRKWCYSRATRMPDGRVLFGDQRYLEEMVSMPSWIEGDLRKKGSAYVIQHPGAAPGPWCIHTRAIDVREGVIHFGGVPLVSFHYSQFKLVEGGGMVCSLPDYAINARQEAILYAPYARALEGR